MAGPNLPTNIASGGTTTGHKSQTDTVHGYVNKLDTTFLSPSDNNVLTYDNATGTYKPEAPAAGGAHAATEVFFSSLTGATDDDKLDNFLDTYNTGVTTYRPHLVLDEVRKYDFDVARVISSGFGIVGPNRAVTQTISGLPVPHEVETRPSGGLFDLDSSGEVHGAYFGNLTIDGSSTNRLMDGHASTVLWTTTFHNISQQNAAGTLGGPTAANKLLVTACNFSGFWNINNIQEPAFVIGGSDCWLTPTMMLLDTDSGLLAPTKYMTIFDSLQNSWVGHWYVTAALAPWLLVNGSSSAHSLWIQQNVVEGRNNSNASPGCLIRWTGGQGMIDSTRFAFAMVDPTDTGHSPTDAGIIHMTGGNLTVKDCTYEKQSGVAESVPFLYANGSSTVARVESIQPVGTAWTGKPVVEAANGATVTVDSSVQAVASSTSTVIHEGVLGSAINIQTGTSYTLAAGDAGKCVDMGNASTMTLTIPVLYKGFVCKVRRYGAGALNTSASSTTFRSAGGLTSVGPQYGEITVSYRTASEVVLSGDLV